MRRNNFHLAPPELNITPLVDVMLVLLVVLMLIIPALRYDEDVNLPQGSQQKTTAAAKKDLKISIKKDRISLNEKSFSPGEFFDNFALLSANFDKSAAVYIAGDREISYERLMQVLAAAKKLGFSKISLQSR